MADTGRKDFTTKAKEMITPNSSKSDYDKTKENVTDSVDKFKGDTQSDSSKGTTQAMFDKGKREKDGTFLDNVKVSFINTTTYHRTHWDSTRRNKFGDESG
jgi:hypothetical protein